MFTLCLERISSCTQKFNNVKVDSFQQLCCPLCNFHFWFCLIFGFASKGGNNAHKWLHNNLSCIPTMRPVWGVRTGQYVAIFPPRRAITTVYVQVQFISSFGSLAVWKSYQPQYHDAYYSSPSKSEHFHITGCASTHCSIQLMGNTVTKFTEMCKNLAIYSIFCWLIYPWFSLRPRQHRKHFQVHHIDIVDKT